MANSLTRLIPDLYAAADAVSREQVGFIPAVYMNAEATRAAVGQSVVYPISRPKTTQNSTSSMTIPEPTDTTVDNDTMVITKSKTVDFGWTGVDQRGLNNGPGYLSVQAEEIAQAMRALTNEVEADLAAAALAGASRAYGTAGTTPFATNTDEASQVRKILLDNGTPMTDLQCVLNTTAGAKLRTLFNINAARDMARDAMSEQGILTNINGMAFRETGAGLTIAAGTATSATTNTTGYAVGSKTITLASAGTGAILAGDVITFAGDSNKYIVASGDADVSNGGTITLVEPGLKVAIPASATAITVIGDSDNCVAFYRNAIHLIARAPEIPEEGDAAVASRMITDPRSGLSFDVRVYQGYKKVRYELGLAWGVKVTQPRHTALILG